MLRNTVLLNQQSCKKKKMGVLSDAPQGFSKAVVLLNSLPQFVLAEMVSFCSLIMSD